MESCITEACCFYMGLSYFHTAVFHFIAYHDPIRFEAEVNVFKAKNCFCFYNKAVSWV